MFLFTIRSKVNPKSKSAKKFRHAGGAYVSCFISFKDFNGAEKLAKLLIKDEGWLPEKRFEAWRIRKGELKTKKENNIIPRRSNMDIVSSSIYGQKAPDAEVAYESTERSRLPRTRSNKALQLTAR